MNISSKSASTTASILVIAGLAGLPVAAMAQEEAIAEYNRYLGNKHLEVVDENRALRDAIGRLDSRIRCLEAPRHACSSRVIGPERSAPEAKPVPTHNL